MQVPRTTGPGVNWCLFQSTRCQLISSAVCMLVFEIDINVDLAHKIILYPYIPVSGWQSSDSILCSVVGMVSKNLTMASTPLTAVPFHTTVAESRYNFCSN